MDLGRFLVNIEPRRLFTFRVLRRFLTTWTVLLGVPHQVEADLVRHQEQEFFVHIVDPRTEQLELFWQDPSGQRLGSFRRLRDTLATQKRELTFAMNAGIFGVDYAPLGLHIENGRTLHALNLGKGGRGNFYLKPNGVFYLVDQTPAIVDAKLYNTLKVQPRLATQSGPLLVVKGALHPAFREASVNRHFRNGIGVTRNGKVAFAISQGLVTFHEFATLFRDVLECDDALYLDGGLSAVYAPSKGQQFLGGDFVGILGVTTPGEK